MATGWAPEGAVQDQIDATIKDAVARARSGIPASAALRHCAECGLEIPVLRREAIPGVQFCVDCQRAHELEEPSVSGYNRRGNKDSQLR